MGTTNLHPHHFAARRRRAGESHCGGGSGARPRTGCRPPTRGRGGSDPVPWLRPNSGCRGALAAAISQAAVELGLVADLGLISTVDIAVAGHASIDSRPFWVATLGYENYGDTDAIDPLRRGPQLSFQALDRQGRARTHIDVSVPADRAQARVDAALAAGGRLVDDSHAADWWTVASPDNHGIDIAAWNDTWD